MLLQLETNLPKVLRHFLSLVSDLQQSGRVLGRGRAGRGHVAPEEVDAGLHQALDVVVVLLEVGLQVGLLLPVQNFL